MVSRMGPQARMGEIVAVTDPGSSRTCGVPREAQIHRT